MTTGQIPPRDYELLLDELRSHVETGPPWMSRLDLVGRGGRAGLDTDVAAAAVGNLVASGRLLAYRVDEDRELLTLPAEECLRRWVRREGESADPDRELIAWLNQRLAEVADD